MLHAYQREDLQAVLPRGHPLASSGMLNHSFLGNYALGRLREDFYRESGHHRMVFDPLGCAEPNESGRCTVVEPKDIASG